MRLEAPGRLVDTDELKQNIYADRLVDTRPVLKLANVKQKTRG
jgi:hypothetical protein